MMEGKPIPLNTKYQPHTKKHTQLSRTWVAAFTNELKKIVSLVFSTKKIYHHHHGEGEQGYGRERRW